MTGQAASLFFIIQVFFLLFLPVLLVVAVWIGNKALMLLAGHLERFQGAFAELVEQQNRSHELLVAILAKVIVQAGRDK